MSIIWLRACVLTENCLIAAPPGFINPLPGHPTPAAHPPVPRRVLFSIADFPDACHANSPEVPVTMPLSLFSSRMTVPVRSGRPS
jgi:hypothetical protein